MKSAGIPRITLIGFGKFGRQYYSELCQMEREGRVSICAIVTRTGNAVGLPTHHTVYSESTYRKQALIGQVDIFVIVVPPQFREDIIRFYSKLGNVLVEKPVCTSSREADNIVEAQRNTSFAIEVSQIFRFHPITKRLKHYLADIIPNLIRIEACFVNSLRHSSPSDHACGYLTAEMNHMLDLANYLTDLNKENATVALSRHDFIEEAYINVGNKLVVQSRCGWADSQYNTRTLSFLTNDSLLIESDFIFNILSYSTGTSFSKEHFNVSASLIAAQLDSFIKYCGFTLDTDHHSSCALNITQALHQVSLIYPHKEAQSSASNKKRIAIIGGGVFGSTIAIRLAQKLDVDLYESASELLTGATLNNQWRHHSGFHYPLSYETVQEIVDHKLVFEDIYSACIRRDIPSYYFISRWAHEISAKRYLAAMNLFGLSYDVVSCPQWVNSESICLALLTDEAVYYIDILRSIISEQLRDTKVNVLLNHDVTCVEVSSCDKTVHSKFKDGSPSIHQSVYDFVIDCTNGLGCYDIIGMPLFRDKVRIELVELAELHVDIPKICFTFIDAPFVSLTSMGRDGDFMLSHRDHSLHARHFVSGSDKKNALRQVPATSYYPNLVKAAQEYIPRLSLAKYKGSRYAWKGISPYTKEVWERPTVIKDHGFGFISVIAGKILTSVSNATEVERIVSSYL